MARLYISDMQICMDTLRWNKHWGSHLLSIRLQHHAQDLRGLTMFQPTLSTAALLLRVGTYQLNVQETLLSHGCPSSIHALNLWRCKGLRNSRGADLGHLYPAWGPVLGKCPLRFIPVWDLKVGIRLVHCSKQVNYVDVLLTPGTVNSLHFWDRHLCWTLWGCKQM